MFLCPFIRSFPRVNLAIRGEFQVIAVHHTPQPHDATPTRIVWCIPKSAIVSLRSSNTRSMGDLWRGSELGMVLSSQRVALYNTFRAELKAVPRLKTPYPSYQCTVLSFLPFITHHWVSIGRKIWDGVNILLHLLLLEASR